MDWLRLDSLLIAQNRQAEHSGRLGIPSWTFRRRVKFNVTKCTIWSVDWIVRLLSGNRLCYLAAYKGSF